MGINKIIRRYKIFKKLLDKGYTSTLNEKSFKKSTFDLTKERLEEMIKDNHRLDEEINQHQIEIFLLENDIKINH
ncbi:protein of unknown function [Tenacibaculum sp. 190130A14a]|uniref:Fur-regulated basic protein FbpA n=1 Tax=Tenacibaculum polynesiense TaxID=3137857 RepID=A0ABM9P774_9FLAO